ncbi:MAG: hypothetical protein DYH13_02750 [Alphaproteobacteria bacterium PRO2]|nr:hypothetical protein [Alphaproteobacteria bacterium PRO2]
MAGEAVSNAANAAGNAVSKGAGFVKRNIGTVFALAAGCLVVAALVSSPAGPGIVALKGKTAIGLQDLGGAVMEGVTEGAGKVSEFAQAGAQKLAEWSPAPNA